MQGTTKEKDVLQSAKLIQGGNGQGDATEIYKIINDMESMNGKRFVTVSSNINIKEHKIKLTAELSGTSYFECQYASKASESNFKLTEKSQNFCKFLGMYWRPCQQKHSYFH